MGDISIIARRYHDGRVRYGWSGNGGYMKSVGAVLLEWYRDPEAVDYLFSLGELQHLGAPHSEENREKWPTILATVLGGSPLEESTTERDIFSRIAFIDYAYLYDVDGRWYYVNPGEIVLKIPLELVARHLSAGGREYGYLNELRLGLYRHIVLTFPVENDSVDQGGMSDEELLAVIDAHDGSDKQGTVALGRRIAAWLDCHDDWVVVRPRDEDGREVDFVYRPRMDMERQETCDWCDVPEVSWPVSVPVPRTDLRFTKDQRIQELYEAIPEMTPEAFGKLDVFDQMHVSAILTLYHIRANALLAGFFSEDDDEALADLRHELFWTGMRTITAVS